MSQSDFKIKNQISHNLSILKEQEDQARELFMEWVSQRGPRPAVPGEGTVEELMALESWLLSIWPAFAAADHVAHAEAKQRSSQKK
jgi:hypothetical protein